MSKIREFVYKHKIPCAVVALLVSSFSIYYFAFANNDEEHDGMTEVVSSSAIVTITDGTPNADGNFDNDEKCATESETLSGGWDCSAANKIVRNFDEIKYEIKYKLNYKESVLDEDKTDAFTRNVTVEVLLPSDFSANLSNDTGSEGNSSTISIESNFSINNKLYDIYTFYLNDQEVGDNENTFYIRITNINAKSGYEIKPIIRLYEPTDPDVQTLGQETNLDEIDKVNLDAVKVSAKEDYGIKLYYGAPIKDESNNKIKTLPIGILTYIPYDSNRGQKGIQVPEEVNFDLNIQADGTGSTIVEDSQEIKNFEVDEHAFITGLFNVIDNLNKITDSSQAVINKISLNDDGKSKFSIGIDNLTYKNNSMTNISDDPENENNGSYLSSKVVTLKVERENSKDDVNFVVTDSHNNSSITYLDNYIPYPGDYISKVDFINVSEFIVEGDQSGPVTVKEGEAIYNYGEEFYIQNKITYASQGGDTLENGFVNYLKIDNSAIKLIELKESEGKGYYSSVNTYNQDDVASNYIYDVEFGVGEWDKNNFELISQTGCPSDINSLTKEELMNLYGGPCIKEKNGKEIQWSHSIAEVSNVNNIILVRLTMNSKYNPRAETTLRFKAQAVSNHQNVGKTFQVVSRGYTDWKTTGNSTERYYLSETVNKSTIERDYRKTEYTNGEITYKAPKSQFPYGNTILISPFRSFINEFRIYDVYESEREEIYSGLNDPMEILVNPVIYKSSFDATITNAIVSVYLPTTIELQLQTGDRKPVNYANPSTQRLCENGEDNTEVCIDYKIYNYSYSEDEIKYEGESAAGTIPTLRVHANVKINTMDNTITNIKAVVNGSLKPNSNSVTVYGAVGPVAERSKDKNITLRNIRKVNLVGTTNTLFIDKNTSYNYNMRAVNLLDNTKLDLLYILPYSGDGVGTGSKFSGTLQASLVGSLPSGYTAYYTTAEPKTILTSILNEQQVEWVAWSNYNALTTLTAIKVVPTTPLAKGSYFVGEDGITVSVKTSNNQEIDSYSNTFYMINETAEVCVDSNNVTGECNQTAVKPASYSSNISYVSVYNRTISGIVFEDLSLDGYSINEKKLKNIPVELFKLKNTEFDAKKPILSISDEDELIKEGLTDKKGSYKFDDLPAGNYYVRYTINCEKYTVTDKNKQDPTIQGDTSTFDSDVDIIVPKENYTEVEEDKTEEDSDEKNTKEDEKDETKNLGSVCYAVSNIITLDNTTVNARNIDAGVKPRQVFDIKLSKYITNVEVNSSSGKKVYKYDNKSKVKIDIRNLKNTTFKVKYGIEIENSKFFPGTIGNIVETIPEGMTFNPKLKENYGWYESDGLLYYSYLKGTLIKPGEKYHLTIVLDLETDNGGDYINFVAANNLQIMPSITNFGEIKPAIDFESTSTENTEEDKETNKEEAEK